MISTILNFTQRDNYFQKYIFGTAMIIAFHFFLNIPNSSTHYEKFATPIENKPIKNTFIILGNNISLVKDTQKKDSKEISYKLKPIV